MKMSYYSIGDVQLRDSDLELIESTSGWLNDNCIYFSSVLLLGKNTNVTNVKIIDPSVVSFMKLQCQDDDEFEELAIGLDISKEQFVFVPINNCNTLSNNNTGTHWSLLILCLPHMVGYHLDSLSRLSNKNKLKDNAQHVAAIQTAEAFSKVLK